MDGVIANFVAGMCTVHNKHNPYVDRNNFGEFDMAKILRIPPVEFWSKATTRFWQTLPLMPDAKEIVEMCEAVADVCILSSPPDGEAMLGKYLWIQRHFPQFKRKFLFGPAKEWASNGKTILVDDYDVNIGNWKGPSILVPRPWNFNHSLDTLTYLRSNLDAYAFAVSGRSN